MINGGFFLNAANSWLSITYGFGKQKFLFFLSCHLLFAPSFQIWKKNSIGKVDFLFFQTSFTSFTSKEINQTEERQNSAAETIYLTPRPDDYKDLEKFRTETLFIDVNRLKFCQCNPAVSIKYVILPAYLLELFPKSAGIFSGCPIIPLIPRLSFWDSPMRPYRNTLWIF